MFQFICSFCSCFHFFYFINDFVIKKKLNIQLGTVTEYTKHCLRLVPIELRKSQLKHDRDVL